MIPRTEPIRWVAATNLPGGVDGFQVDTDALARIALRVTEAADTVRHAENTGRIRSALAHDAAPDPAALRRRGVPGWLRDHDHRWWTLREEVLDAHRFAVQALHDAANAYLDSDARAEALITKAGAPNHGLTAAGPSEPPQSTSPDTRSWTAPDLSSGWPAAGSSAETRAPEPDDLDTAIELWRGRRNSATAAVQVLHDALTDLPWHGPAAEAFTSWTRTHLNRCTALAEHADAIHRALTSTDSAARHGITPPEPPPPTAATALALPAGPARRSVSTLPITPADADRPTAPPETDADAHLADARPIVSARTTSPDADDPPVPNLDHTYRVERAAAEPHDPQPGPAQDVTGERHMRDRDTNAHYTATGDDTPPAAAATMLPMAALPAAAIASTALFARTDRAHHVIRDIHDVRQPPPPPAQHPGTMAGAPSRPTAPRHEHPSAAPPNGPAPLWRSRPATRDEPAAIWVNLARADDPPAWVDLAATHGLGLNGPGALDIARTLQHRLAEHHPRTLLITPEQLARQLFGHRSHRRVDEPGSTDNPHTENGGAGTHTAEHRGILVVPDPAQGLRACWDEVERRRAIGLHSAPVVLLAPAPTTVAARTALARALQQLPPAAFTAVLLGHWDNGTTLTITDDHHVSQHHRPPAGRPPLTGAHLEPTAPDTPGARHPLMADQPRPDDHTGPDPVDVPDSGETPNRRTALALSVLGPVQLRYRRPTTASAGDGPNGRDRPAPEETPTEEVFAVPRISRPARELLAYLAAHPAGATRDAIIEALWPDSSADRRDTAFHTTISRLRKRLRDTTDTDTVAEIITATDGRWHINRAHVTVDYWTFLETHPRNPDPTLRRHDHHLAVRLYHGPFAADVTGEWAHTIREATRRRYLEAINDLTESEIADSPDLALDLLERARNLEPLNEAIYRNIMRIHLNNHRRDAARGTYELLCAHLATIDVTPDAETEQLAAVIRSRS